MEAEKNTLIDYQDAELNNIYQRHALRGITNIYVGMIDRKKLIKAIYDNFRIAEVEYLYQRLEGYCPLLSSLREKLFASDLTEEELEELSGKNIIESFKNIIIKIKFTEDDEIIFDESDRDDYINIIFSFIENEYREEETLRPDYNKLYKLTSTLNLISDELKCQKDKIKELDEKAQQPKWAKTGYDYKALHEVLKREQWEIEEELYKYLIIIYELKKDMIRKIGRIYMQQEKSKGLH